MGIMGPLSGRIQWMGLVGAIAMLVGTSLLPDRTNRIAAHMVANTVRAELSTLAPAEGETPRPLRLDISADPEIREAVEAVVHTLEGWVLSDTIGDTLRVEVQTTRNRIDLRGSIGEHSFSQSRSTPNGMSLWPPLLAVWVALLFRRVLLGLGLGVFTGALWVQGWRPVAGAKATVTDYLYPVLTDGFNLQILGFTFALAGMIAVVAAMGGTRGLVNAVRPYAKGRKRAQIATWCMGLLMFFDDYANTMLVGTTARDLTDEEGISRERLAYIVDSTSAPVAGVAVVSTWIGYEVGLFDDLLSQCVGIAAMPANGYALFFEALPYRFYCWFALLLVLISSLMGREFGSMWRAETRHREKDAPSKSASNDGEDATGSSAWNALLPLGTVVFGMLGLMLAYGHTGLASLGDLGTISGWRDVLTAASDFIARILMFAALLGSAVALLLALSQRRLSIREAAKAYTKGMGTLLEASGILILAWSIKAVCDDTGTGLVLVAMLADHIPVMLLPFVVFLLAGVVAFCTGTSWGTMALVLPVATPLAVGLSADPIVIVVCMGAVLDGAIWGDHCSPLSDTTVLTSAATECDLADHVRTQMPYATTALIAAGFCGYMGVGLGLPVWLSMVSGVILMVGILRLFGQSIEDTSSVVAPNKSSLNSA